MIRFIIIATVVATAVQQNVVREEIWPTCIGTILNKYEQIWYQRSPNMLRRVAKLLLRTRAQTSCMYGKSQSTIPVCTARICVRSSV